MVANQTTNIILPCHLLMGALSERTGTCGELSIHFPDLYDSLSNGMNNLVPDHEIQGVHYEPFASLIAPSTQRVLENAKKRMESYNQVFLNEGLIVQAIFDINDPFITSITSGIDIIKILEIVSYPRDMVVSLRDYLFPAVQHTGLTIRKATPNDLKSLKSFIAREFGTRWLPSVENGFSKKNIPIFLAEDCGELIGFACYDVVRDKKGLFGPMGTALAKRIHKIGYSLLHHCLYEMKEIGYEYAVIGEAGPIEFYEKSCHAVLIPKQFVSIKNAL